jgi:hypothetical protein
VLLLPIFNKFTLIRLGAALPSSTALDKWPDKLIIVMKSLLKTIRKRRVREQATMTLLKIRPGLRVSAGN